MITPRHPQGASSPDEDPTGVRALLSSLPEPGPMPPELVARITASLEREQQERAQASEGSGSTVTPLISRSGGRSPASAGGPSRLRRFVALGGAAAAVVAVAAVGTVVALDQRPDVPAAASVASQSQDSGGMAGGQAESKALPGTTTPVFFEASGMDYTSNGFAEQAKAMQASNTTPMHSDALKQPQVQKLGPPMELSQCIKTLGAQLQATPDKVWVDLGTYDGAPAVIIVVTTGDQSKAWAVGRTCRAGEPAVLTGPTTLA